MTSKRAADLWAAMQEEFDLESMAQRMWVSITELEELCDMVTSKLEGREQ